MGRAAGIYFKEEELSVVAAQGQKGMRVDLNKIRLITAAGITLQKGSQKTDYSWS